MVSLWIHKGKKIVAVVVFVYVLVQWILWCKLHDEENLHDVILHNGALLSFPIEESHKDDNAVHIVFSTDCSGYQHWQGILMWYSAKEVGFRGNMTRIASGCSAEEQESIQQEWQKLNDSRFRVHFTPSFSLHQKYKYSNKPGGLLHFLQNNKLDPNQVIALLDPDMILLKPLTSTLRASDYTRRQRGKRQIEWGDSKGRPQLLATMLDDGNVIPTRVTTGHPAGQHFGVGGAWTQAGLPNAKPVWQNFSKSYVCGGRCARVTYVDASRHYNVGPVYLATVEDWHTIASTWWDFLPRVHESYPYLLAEMYAMTMAVASLSLNFTLLSSYMITGATVDSPTEAWSWIDDHIREIGTHNKICQGADTYHLPDMVPKTLPTTLHYCQRFLLANHKWAKHKIPHNFFSCHGQPLPLNATELQMALKNPKVQTKDLRTAWVLCHLIPTANKALLSYQQDVCGDKG